MSLEDIKENDVVSFFIRDGKPVYEASYRYRLSEFFESVSGKYPALSSFNAWLPYVRVTRKNILSIVETKGHDQHYVAVHESMVNILQEYDRRIEELVPGRTCFFPCGKVMSS